MPDVSIIVAWLVLTAAGAWDLYVVPRYGLASGRTASWQLYTDARKWPVLGVVAGVLLCWVTARNGVPIGAAVLYVVAGHIFATMRGAT